MSAPHSRHERARAQFRDTINSGRIDLVIAMLVQKEGIPGVIAALIRYAHDHGYDALARALDDAHAVQTGRRSTTTQ